MKLASFTKDGRRRFGAVEANDMVVDVTDAFGPEIGTLRELLVSGRLEEAAARSASPNLPRYPVSTITFDPVIPDPGAIYCIGLNYANHVEETGREITEHPTVFLRLPHSQAGHGAPLLLPPESENFDFEGEIALVIGTGGRRIAPERAAEHVAGYACYNDGSLRDWQAANTQWTAGKNFAGTGAFGPWMVTADEIPPDHTMTLVTRLNGTEVQRTTTDLLLHDFARLIAHVSTFAPLSPGDVIVTGTPGGVGFKRTPPLFMQPGDLVEVEVDLIGTLANRVAREEV